MWYFKTVYVILLVLGGIGLALIATDDYYTFDSFMVVFVSVVVLCAMVGIMLFSICFIKHTIVII